MPSKKTILVVDHNSLSLISLAEHLGGAPHGEVLLAHSQSGAIELASQYKPEIAIVVSSLVATGGRQLLPDLIKEVSPQTKIVIARDAEPANAGESRERI
jgi:DNA-binding NarL/FixJ family response regulator